MKHSIHIFTVTAALMLGAKASDAQGLKLSAPSRNAVLEHYQDRSSRILTGITDTLDLPFMEDFTSASVYPDPTRWTDRQVFVGNGFGISAPSYGVATFDHLNETGAPYSALNINEHRACDSLTSQPINLFSYKSGVNTLFYGVKDSVYLSFFFQPQGWGDMPESSDSLVLKFRDNSGNWNTVWKKSGGTSDSFVQVIIGIKSAVYLHNAFQFRFVNFSKSTGNLNHWHLDYIRMNRQRTYNDLTLQDVAINRNPGSLLKFYSAMPYRQFKAAPAAETAAAHLLTVRNNGKVQVNTQYSFTARNRYNALIGQLAVGANNRNILAGKDSTEPLLPVKLDTLSGTEPWVDMQYNIIPLSNDATPGNYNAAGNNNLIRRRQLFPDYLAYDDGTAEGGIGLDYSFIQSGTGQFAVKFHLNQKDTLRGLAVFFNRSLEDVSARPFTLRIWQSITEPPATTTNDVILFDKVIERPVYTDSINGFHYFIFDSSVVIPAGTFYAGWKQTVKYVLNVGYDNNYRYLNGNAGNPNVFYNLLGYWESPGIAVKGTPMIRPLMGSSSRWPLSIQKTGNELSDFWIYPNPSSSGFTVESSSAEEVIWTLSDITGKQLDSGSFRTSGFIRPLCGSGMYLLQLHTSNGNTVKKLIVE